MTANLMDIKIITKIVQRTPNHKFAVLGNMEQFLVKHILPKLTQGEMGILNSPLSIKEIK